MAIALSLATAVEARVLMTQAQALAEAFPGADIERRAVVLSESELARIEELGGSRPESRSVVTYVARRNGELVGTGYFDAHVVRTLPEVVLVVVDPAGKVARVDVLAFREPEEYRASPRWSAQFLGRTLEPDLALKRGIHGITGATLTARAMTSAVRRMLAIHAVLAARTEASGDGS